MQLAEFEKQAVSKPFIKWKGGKRRLLNTILSKITVDFTRYYEPFLGGGALFFFLLQNNDKISKYHLSDINNELIDSYITIRDNPRELVDCLTTHKKKYLNNRHKYYYFVRDNFVKEGMIEKSARLIFLNKTCFNGLYRVNKKGKFNVPIGNYPLPDIVQEDNILAISEKIQKNINLESCDFQKSLQKARKNDFIFLDPPYYPVSSSSTFTNYWSEPFNHNEHLRLYDEFKRLDKKGCHVLLTNSNTPQIKEIFSEYDQIEITGTNSINCDGNNRDNHKQLIIRNYA